MLIYLMKFLLDTCIYGVLVDKKHQEYENVKAILDYAKSHKEEFATTFIVFKELDYLNEEYKSTVFPEYFESNSITLELAISDKQKEVDKLAWRYIQKLRISDAGKVFADAENYSWACHANLDVFITLNRKNLLAAGFQSTLKQINEEMRIKYVEIMTPKQFLDFLGVQTSL